MTIYSDPNSPFFTGDKFPPDLVIDDFPPFNDDYTYPWTSSKPWKHTLIPKVPQDTSSSWDWRNLIPKETLWFDTIDGGKKFVLELAGVPK